MNKFFEVIRNPVEEGYSTFEEDIKEFSMLNGEQLKDRLNKEDAKVKTVNEQKGEVEFRNVSARYESSEQLVLRNLNFEIKPK
jgi:ABC-type multidrug transport system fused ATPase/permease subunit